MTLMGQCAECEENRRPGRPIERRRLFHGPDGRHLCREHYHDAFKIEVSTTVENTTVTAESFNQLKELVGTGMLSADRLVIDGLELTAEDGTILVSREST